jgi:hypothetical protein
MQYKTRHVDERACTSTMEGVYVKEDEHDSLNRKCILKVQIKKNVLWVIID